MHCLGPTLSEQPTPCAGAAQLHHRELSQTQNAEKETPLQMYLLHGDEPGFTYRCIRMRNDFVLQSWTATRSAFKHMGSCSLVPMFCEYMHITLLLNVL